MTLRTFIPWQFHVDRNAGVQGELVFVPAELAYVTETMIPKP